MFLLAVVFLLYLTRKRDPVDWSGLYGTNKASVLSELILVVVYLFTTQLSLSYFKIGLHFPGPNVYKFDEEIGPSHIQARNILFLPRLATLQASEAGS